jgi:glutamyl-tRNA(Gln) amidotransferase subunit D
VDGIVVGHGTDTMHHTAAALTFMVQDSPVPIVMVGSQRSSDRPSSDAAINLINATRPRPRATSPRCMVCMFGPTSDKYGLLHRGTRVRKMHSELSFDVPDDRRYPAGMIDRNVTTFRRTTIAGAPRSTTSSSTPSSKRR